MTRKHFNAIAKAINELMDELDEHSADTRAGVAYTVNALIDVLQKENSNFDADRFRTACGL